MLSEQNNKFFPSLFMWIPIFYGQPAILIVGHFNSSVCDQHAKIVKNAQTIHMAALSSPLGFNFIR